MRIQYLSEYIITQMQNQIYQCSSILQKAQDLYGQKKKINDPELKTLLLCIATKIQQIQKEKKDFYLTQSQMHEKIKYKMLQIEERRKAWDEMMAEIFNDNQKVAIMFNEKMNGLDSFKQQTADQLLKLTKQTDKINQLMQDRSNIKIIVNDKIQKAKEEFNSQMQKKIAEIKKDFQKEKGKQFKFSILCKQATDLINKEIDINTWKQQKSSRIADDQQQKATSEKFCSNLEIMIKNMHALQGLQSQVSQLDPIISRFENKIVEVGNRIEVMEQKVGDLLSQRRPIKTEQALTEKKQNKRDNKESAIKFLMRGKFFNRFIVDANIITYVDSQEDSSCMLMGCQSLMRVPSFCIQIVHSSNNYISVGVVDQNYQIYKDCWEKQNFIFMRALGGEVYLGPNNKIKQTGASFKVGDQVRVEVNFAEMTIMWYINNNLRAVYKSKKLKEQNIMWVPMVRFYNSYDSIKWLG